MTTTAQADARDAEEASVRRRTMRQRRGLTTDPPAARRAWHDPRDRQASREQLGYGVESVRPWSRRPTPTAGHEPITSTPASTYIAANILNAFMRALI